MTQTITGLFDRYDDARRAVQDLEAAGVAHRDISIVAHDKHDDAGTDRASNMAEPAAEDAGAGAGIGATIGGVGGLLAGLGLLAIPGIGPVVAAGWLAATAAGAAGGALVGAAAGGLVGALTHAGVPEDDAHVYAEGVRRGGTLVTAKVDEPMAATARTILSDDRTVQVAERRQAYQSQGWNAFDDTAPAYSDSEIAAERARYTRT
ncbi:MULTISPECIES: general stress protein [unclassified Sphingomonas]|uniref:general stress protein n=1 Tax=unclassified Sphingomonas TaxID=196159 RepID=UPI001F573A86|nr:MULTISPECIES: general stress protein [unclassified Sphingomonas]